MSTGLTVKAGELMFLVAPPAIPPNQAQLVNVAIAAEPHRAGALADAYCNGWEFAPGQLGADGLPKAGQLPRPTRGGAR